MDNELDNFKELEEILSPSPNNPIGRFMIFVGSYPPVLLAVEGEFIEEDIRYAGYYPEDFFTGGLPKEPGFWIWEGTIDLHYDYYNNESDPEYVGKWKKATEEEIILLHKFGSPWVDPPTDNTPSFNDFNSVDWFNSFQPDTST